MIKNTRVSTFRLLALALPLSIVGIAFVGSHAAAGVAGAWPSAVSPAERLFVEAKTKVVKGKTVKVNKNVKVNKTLKVNKNVKVNKTVYVNRPVKRWSRKPHYGNVIAGVALGTMIGVTAVGVAPPPPASSLCWYWSNPVKNRGYWDYCY